MLMTLEEAKEYSNNKLGGRCKQYNDSVIIYANAFTLIVDLFKLLKRKCSEVTNLRAQKH